MTRHDSKAPAKLGDRVARMCPDNELKSPIKKFEDTFSAETVVMEAFFSTK
jgi:hypothetical protein